MKTLQQITYPSPLPKDSFFQHFNVIQNLMFSYRVLTLIQRQNARKSEVFLPSLLMFTYTKLLPKSLFFNQFFRMRQRPAGQNTYSLYASCPEFNSGVVGWVFHQWFLGLIETNAYLHLFAFGTNQPSSKTDIGNCVVSNQK
ncbi:hypothetical protein ACFO3I_00020 [Rheinheimera marina]|uniref:Uncharacterized protein n=1 Tax=Rheinheimera marina TaxID=1774958 RepID=A0ABV9JFY7_9GAMM